MKCSVQMFRLNLKTRFFIFLFLCFYFGLIWHYSVNVPFWDDYDVILGYHSVVNLLSLIEFKRYYVLSPTQIPYLTLNTNSVHAQDYFTFLFAQHMEHRIFVNRIIEWLQIILWHQLNIKILIVIANVFRLGIFALIYFAIRHKENWTTCLLLLFIFQLADWNIAFWAAAGLQTYVVIFLVWLSLFLLHKSSSSLNSLFKQWSLFFGAMITAFLATFAYANGMLAFLLGLAILYVQKAKAHFILYFIEGLICIGLYFYHFHKIVKTVWTLKFIPYFIIFMGNIYHLHQGLIVPFIVGGVGLFIAAYMILQFFKQGTLKYNLLFYYLVFIVLSGLIDAIARVGLFGLTEAVSTRYSIYAILFFSLLLAWYFSEQRKAGVFLSLLIISSFIVNTHYGIEAQKKLNQQLLAYHIADNGVITGLVYPNQAVPNQSLAQARALGLYQLPDL